MNGRVGTRIDWEELVAGLRQDRLPLARHLMNRMLETVPLASSAEVLNVEGGGGSIALLLAEHVAHVYCIDDWPSDYEWLTKRIKSAAVPNISIAMAPSDAVPYADSSFDGAFWAIHGGHPVDKLPGLQEVIRVLKPGAPVGLILWHELTEPESQSKPDPGWLVNCAANAGFQKVGVQEFSADFRAPSRTALLEALEAHALVRASPRRAKYVMKAILAEGLPTEAIDVGFLAFIITARRSFSD